MDFFNMRNVWVWSRSRKITAAAVSLLFLYTMIGFLILPPILKNVLESRLTELLHRQATIGRVRCNPYALSVTIEDFRLAERRGNTPFITVKQLFLNAELLSILRKAVIVKSFLLVEPRLAITRNPDLSYNFSDLVSPAAGEDTSAAASPLFSVSNILITGGTINFTDSSLAAPFETELGVITLQVDAFNTMTPRRGNAVLTLKTKADEQASIQAQFSLLPFSIEGQASFTSLKLARYDPYLRQAMKPRLTEGVANLSTRFRVGDNEGVDESRLSDLSLVLHDFTLQDGEERLLAVGGVDVSGVDVDLNRQAVQIDALRTEQGSVAIIRSREGEVNLARMMGAGNKRDIVPPAIDGGGTSPAWVVTLSKATVKQYAISFNDQTPSRPALTTVDIVELTAENISTVEHELGNFIAELRVNGEGALSLQGNLMMNPLQASCAADLKQLPLKSLQSYISPVADLAISDGLAFLTADLEIAAGTQENISLTARGNASINRFASLDPLRGETFVNWDVLRLKNIDFRSQPQSLAMEAIDLENPFISLNVDPAGVFNVQSILRSSAAHGTGKSGAEEGDKRAGVIRIDAVTVRNGRLNFLDRAVTPNYATSLTELNTTITGLSSLETAKAPVELRAVLDQQAKLVITGAINPLRQNLFARLKVDFRDIELSPASPYAGKYMGYMVDKGKLFLDLEYLIEDRKIVAQNRFFLDQFTLGKAVDSPTTTNLPVSLAVALLKNRKGEISLDVPVKGDLDDPEFSAAGVIIKVIVNLIAKAATSPFALLGALIPEGEDVQHLQFAPASAELNAGNRGKLQTVARALYERPALKMEISGQASPADDRGALRRKRMEELIRLEKVKAVTAGKGGSSDMGQIQVSDEEYDRYLVSAMATAGLGKPKVGGTAEPAAERVALENLLLEKIEITDDDLRLLAHERASQVKSFLVEAGPVESERLFVIEPRFATAGDEETAVPGGVELTIR